MQALPDRIAKRRDCLPRANSGGAASASGLSKGFRAMITLRLTGACVFCHAGGRQTPFGLCYSQSHCNCRRTGEE